MIQIIPATFEDGVFKPDVPLVLPPHTRVRLMVDPLEGDAEKTRGQEAWDAIEQIWERSVLNSQGERLSRDQLHERDWQLA